MLVGHGMMARTFWAFRDRPDVVIFASGVSNSLETDPRAFERERRLLQRIRAEHTGALLVYFGTCSVDDPDRWDTQYVRHKLHMESLLAASPGPWLVLRVPLAIGRNPGSHTLAQYLYDCIMQGTPFEVWEGAARFPIDVEDVLRIGSRLIEDRAMWGRRINVALRRFPVLDFVHILERITGRPAMYRVARKGRSFDLDCPEVMALAPQLGLDLGAQYLERVLRKYFGGQPGPRAGAQ